MAALASEYLADVLEPEKFAAAIFGVTLTFTILSTNAVGFRTWLRLRRKQLGNDDYLMCAAMVSIFWGARQIVCDVCWLVEEEKAEKMVVHRS